MPIDHCQAVFIVFRGNLAGWVGAEGADLVVKGGGVVHQLGLIEILVEKFHDFIPNFHPDADIHSSYFRLNAMAFADVAEPVRPLPPHGSHHLRGIADLALVCNHAFCAAFFYYNVFHHGIEFHLNAMGQEMFLKAGVDLIPLLCAEMADRAFDQL